jgi:hypothetical protein
LPRIGARSRSELSTVVGITDLGAGDPMRWVAEAA